MFQYISFEDRVLIVYGIGFAYLCFIMYLSMTSKWFERVAVYMNQVTGLVTGLVTEQVGSRLRVIYVTSYRGLESAFRRFKETLFMGSKNIAIDAESENGKASIEKNIAAKNIYGEKYSEIFSFSDSIPGIMQPYIVPTFKSENISKMFSFYADNPGNSNIYDFCKVRPIWPVMLFTMPIPNEITRLIDEAIDNANRYSSNFSSVSDNDTSHNDTSDKTFELKVSVPLVSIANLIVFKLRRERNKYYPDRPAERSGCAVELSDFNNAFIMNLAYHYKQAGWVVKFTKNHIHLVYKI